MHMVRNQDKCSEIWWIGESEQWRHFVVSQFFSKYSAYFSTLELLNIWLELQPGFIFLIDTTESSKQSICVTLIFSVLVALLHITRGETSLDVWCRLFIWSFNQLVWWKQWSRSFADKVKQYDWDKTVGGLSPTHSWNVLDSIPPVKILLADIIRRLELKGKPVGVYPAASQEDIESVWNSLHLVDSSLDVADKHPRAPFKSHAAVDEFIKHCCQSGHYFLCIKKCGASLCSICKPPCLPPEAISFHKLMATTNPLQMYMALRNFGLHFLRSLQRAKS